MAYSKLPNIHVLDFCLELREPDMDIIIVLFGFLPTEGAETLFRILANRHIIARKPPGSKCEC